MEQNSNEVLEEVKKTNIEVEEVGERRTSVLGYFLLTIMVIFLIIVGQTVFSDLGSILKKPQYPSTCVTALNFGSYNDSSYGEDFNNHSFSGASSLSELAYFPSSCSFGDLDKRFSLDVDFKSVESQVRQIVTYNEQIRSLKNKVSKGEEQINQLGSRYDISLQEKMAGEQKPVMDSGTLQNDIVGQQDVVVSNQKDIRNLTNQRDQLVLKVTPNVSRLQDNLKKAINAYNDAFAWYKFKIFLLKLIFILPVFGFALYYYLRLKKNNSPYTIIYTAIVVATSVLFLEIILILLYDIIPRGLLAKIFKIFMSTPILRYILYYGAVLVVLGIFGGIVYYIQKRVYDSRNVAMRRLRDNKCPNCSFIINMFYNNCPKCGRQLKEKCVYCGNLRLSDLPHCPNCGK